MCLKFTSIDNNTRVFKKYTDLKGEIVLICSSDDVWQIWEDMFKAYDDGDLIDPDTGVPFKQASNYVRLPPLLREWFRCLQALSDTELKTLATHILHAIPGRSLVHPKVVFKKPKNFRVSCFLAKEWVENRKQKSKVVAELHKLRPNYKMFQDGEVVKENWRKFKKEYNFTSASMQALIRETGRGYYKEKGTRSGKNKTISEGDIQILKNFMKEKKIVKFEGEAHFNFVDNTGIRFSGWGLVTRAQTREGFFNFPFAVIDYRMVPGSHTKGDMSSPFFDQFMKAFVKFKSPNMHEPEVWLWIVDAERQEQVHDLYRSTLSDQYTIHRSQYMPCPSEGVAHNMEKKNKQISCITLYFLVKIQRSQSLAGLDPEKDIKSIFKVADGRDKDRALYDESKYVIHTQFELRLDFYVEVLRMFTRKGDTVFNVFGGSKFLYAGMVSSHIHSIAQ